MATPATALRGTSGRSVEESVVYGVGHRIRVEVLAALHEGPATSSELARIVHQPLSNLSHHVEELLASGSIEVADVRRVGNVMQNVYRVVELPEYTSEEFAAMSEAERQATLGLVLQASMAEALASLWAGKLVNDSRVMMAWNRITLDEQGRIDLAEEQDRSWLRMQEIEAEAANRRARSGDAGTTYVVTSFGYERSRTEAPPPVTTEER
jgi:DNA-binding HxlR family transcriptional regulator